jgi:hypothetical protein
MEPGEKKKKKHYIINKNIPFSVFWVDWNELRREPGNDLEKSLFN